MPSITKQVRRIVEKIDNLQQQLCDLQNECTHPNVLKTYKADTGNYDPSVDAYWIVWDCSDCGKLWHTDQ